MLIWQRHRFYYYQGYYLRAKALYKIGLSKANNGDNKCARDDYSKAIEDYFEGFSLSVSTQYESAYGGILVAVREGITIAIMQESPLQAR